MAIALTHKQDLLDGVDRTSYTIPSTTLVSGRAYFLSFAHAKTASAPDVPTSITTTGITWTAPANSTLLYGPASGPTRRVSFRYGICTASGSSTTVISFGANTQLMLNGSIEEGTDLDTTDVIVTTSAGTATDSVTSYTVTRSIAGTVNAMFAVFAHNGGSGTQPVPTAPLTSLYGAGGGTPTCALTTAWAIGSTAANPNATSGATRQWGGLAYVLRAPVTVGHPQFSRRRRALGVGV